MKKVNPLTARENESSKMKKLSIITKTLPIKKNTDSGVISQDISKGKQSDANRTSIKDKKMLKPLATASKQMVDDLEKEEKNVIEKRKNLTTALFRISAQVNFGCVAPSVNVLNDVFLSSNL